MILMMICSMSITSCVTATSGIAAQEISYYDDYVYLGVTYPVLYINSIPHYFYCERWIVVPTNNYHCLRHYHRPMYFRGTPPRDWRPNYRHDYHQQNHRPTYYNHRPNPGANYRPSIQHRPNTQPTRPGGYTNHGNSQRPIYRGGMTPSRGGRR